MSSAFHIAYKYPDNTDLYLIQLAYYPFTTTRQLLDTINRVSIVWQKLIYLASRNDAFIYSVYSQIAISDPLVGNLIRIKKMKKNEEHNSLVLTRVDYYLNEDSEAKIV